MNYKALALGAVIGLAAALVPSCGGKSTCGASNCAGCCDSNNNCVKTPTDAACGKAGLTCNDCTKKPATPTCNVATGLCSSGSTGGGGGSGGGGGTTGGGAGGGAGGGSACTGCCSGNLSPGSGGCVTGTCVGGTAATNCGANGQACQNCSTMQQLCTNHVCTGGAGGGSGNDGGVTGEIGSACTTNADCNKETGTTPGTTTTGYYCKKEQLQITPSATGGLQIAPGATYPGGYCTHRCVADSDCGSQGFCSWFYGLGIAGEAENYCIGKCDAQGACRTGYNCLQFGTDSAGKPLLGCLLAGSDGGQFDVFDAGIGGNPLVQGGACMMNSDCQPPNTGSCIPGTFDGGPSGFPGGSCTADCTMHPTNSWCGNGAVCAPSELDIGDNLGYLIDWGCLGKCWSLPDGGEGLIDGGAPLYTCRSGYHCRAVFQDNSGGCEANCDNAGAGCASGFTCDTTTHLCQ